MIETGRWLTRGGSLENSLLRRVVFPVTHRHPFEASREPEEQELPVKLTERLAFFHGKMTTHPGWRRKWRQAGNRRVTWRFHCFQAASSSAVVTGGRGGVGIMSFYCCCLNWVDCAISSRRGTCIHLILVLLPNPDCLWSLLSPSHGALDSTGYNSSSILRVGILPWQFYEKFESQQTFYRLSLALPLTCFECQLFFCCNS